MEKVKAIFVMVSLIFGLSVMAAFGIRLLRDEFRKFVERNKHIR